MSEDVKNQDQKDTQKDAPKDDVEAMRAELAALRKEKESWQKKDETLNDKVRKENEDRAKKDSDTKSLEAALLFNLSSADFIRSNESFLSKEASDIFKAADRETYSSAIEKANATKAALIQSFFSQQSNVDLLTDSQKSTLADYLKLTKNGKEERAKDIYDNLFEPALSTLKRVKKAEELSKSKFGYRDSSKGDSQYKEKLMAGSKKHFLGEKS